MKYNTDHLGYKLFSGKLSSNRNHSEQLGKFVAGFFDSDGTVVYTNTGKRRIHCSITQSEKNDKDGKLLKALRDFYNIGTVVYITKQEHTNQYRWNMNAKDTHKFYNLIGKHLIIKRIHFQSMLDFYSNNTIDDNNLREESRKVSASLTHKKHISSSYLAGLIAGDGYIRAEIGKVRYSKSAGRNTTRNVMSIRIGLHLDDKPVLDKLHSDFGGNICIDKKGYVYWQKTLGTRVSGAHHLVKDLMRNMCLDVKYEKLNQINIFYKQLAETKRKESDKDN